jgi:hypothetical protein
MQAPFGTAYSAFQLSESRRINWRNIESADIKRVLQVAPRQGDLRPLHLVMDDLAYANIQRDGDDYAEMVRTTPEACKTLSAVQVGLQYLLYTQDYLRSHCEALAQSLEQEKRHLESLAVIAKRQRTKQRRLQRELDELGSRGYHLDMLGDLVKSDASSTGQMVSRLKQSSLKEQSHRGEFKADDLLESDFELSQSHPADFKSARQEEAKVTRLELPVEEQYSRFSSPATHFKNIYAGKPLSELFARDKAATSLSQEELTDSRLSSSAQEWEAVKLK